MQHTQQVVQLAVFGAFAFMVVLLQIGCEAQSCPLSAGWEAVMIFP
ncbi:mercury resistance protein (plasmid) [Klebsiella sp. LY]|uniref:Mercury resistance protein n=1 Tax=Klebsiella pneumoniae TaxID=573 RepID=A0A1B1LR05_KLEPN|nr:mercury resistance protein [Klebsiella pneumoniae]AZZ16680.1 mercury resistance protein [Klebsiella sp. LY]